MNKQHNIYSAKHPEDANLNETELREIAKNNGLELKEISQLYANI